MTAMKVAIVALLIAIGAIFAASGPASAAPAASASLLQVSSDGVTYGADLADPVFDPAIRMIPDSAQNGVFWVKNNSTESGYLRVVIGGVTGSNSDLLGALSISASTPGHAGTSKGLTAAQPCIMLTQGQLLQPGDTIRIDVALMLADLVQAEGQNGTVDFDFQAGLSSVDPAGTPATTCIAAGVVVPPFGGGTTPTTGSGTHPHGSHGVAPADEPQTVVTPEPEIPGIHGGGLVPLLFDVVSNTYRFFQEDTIGLWVLCALIGALVAWLVFRRRRRADEENGVL